MTSEVRHSGRCRRLLHLLLGALALLHLLLVQLVQKAQVARRVAARRAVGTAGAKAEGVLQASVEGVVVEALVWHEGGALQPAFEGLD